MAKKLQQEVYRTDEAATLTGFARTAILEAIRENRLYAFKMRASGAKPPIYIIPRYALYAWLGHQGAVEVAKQFDPGLRKQVMYSADIKREVARLAQFEPKVPWRWDGVTNPLRHWRHHLGFSGMKVAAMLGINERSIFSFERGAFRPGPKATNTYCKFMPGVEPAQLTTMIDQWHAQQRLLPVRVPHDQEVITGWGSAPEFLEKLAQTQREQGEK